MDPEKVHELTIEYASQYPSLAKIFRGTKIPASRKYQLDIGSIKWSFPVALAAGLDKNARAISFFSELGFGAIEVGTVTPLMQSGNPKPRLFRYIDEESLRNRMGFNNAGMDEVFKNIVHTDANCVLGVNLGKNKNTLESKAKEDYLALYEKFASVSDYLVINISSPNTLNLRKLQQKDALLEILNYLDDARENRPCPLFVKISPDIDENQIDEIITVAKKKTLAGIIATNTTIIENFGPGGVSGKLLYSKGKEVRNYLARELKATDLSLIGVGGFSSFDEIFDYWCEGGSAVQVYTSFIYQGPKFLHDIKDGLDKKLQEYNLNSVNELIKKLHEFI